MEFIFQAWDELDDLLTACCEVLWRYAASEAGAIASLVRMTLAIFTQTTVAMRRGHPGWRPGQDSNLRPSA